MAGRREVLKAAGSVAAVSIGAGVGLATASEGRVIERDVCVIGGGSAGTYTAVRLRDLGRSVVVLEQQQRLGGHAQTYVDPASGVPIDIGVVVLENSALVRSYLQRFGVPGIPIQFPPGDTRYVDFRTGQVVPGYAPPDPGLALFTYQQILASQFSYLDNGFELPDPVPDDLVLPFGSFVHKYGLGAMVPTVFDFTQGIGNLLEVPALYVLKLFSLSVVNSILGIGGSGFLLLPFGTSQLYAQAAQFLGPDAILGASVQRVRRDDGRIEVRVRTPQGPRTLRSRKLVVAMPPTQRNLSGFDLSRAEERLFGRLQPHCYATAVVQLSGLPPGVALRNTAPDTAYELPPLPGPYGLTPTAVPGLWNLKFGAASPLKDEAIRAQIARDIARVASAGTLPVQLEATRVFSNHTPFQLMVGSEEIAAGFYRSTQALQGARSTYYNAAAFQTNNSSLIWRRTESLLPALAA